MQGLEICSLCLISTGNLLPICTSFLFLKSYGQEHGTKSGREKDSRPMNVSQLAQHEHYRWVDTGVLHA